MIDLTFLLWLRLLLLLWDDWIDDKGWNAKQDDGGDDNDVMVSSTTTNVLG